MSPMRPCLVCGALVQGASYCPTHAPKRPSHPSRQTPGRGSGSQVTKFRQAVLTRAGNRCEAIVNGVQCTETQGLQAHHLLGLRQGGSNDVGNGVALCLAHHRALHSALRSKNVADYRRS
jgi:hypothetical protein